MRPELSLTTLGHLVATASAEAGTRTLARGKPVALLAFLAASPGRRASRERLASLLWSDGSSEAARQNLRQTIWYLKRRLGDWIVATDDFLELVPQVDLDRDRFLIAVREQRLKDAVTIYAGEFIPDFAAPGAADFEQWADIERRRLRGVFVGCCDTLARQELAAGHFQAATDLARRARDAAPLDFATWRLLLESITSARDAMSAMAEIEHLDALIASEELDLDDGTRAAVRAARAMMSGAAAAVGDVDTVRRASSGRTETLNVAAETARGAQAVLGDTGTFAPELIGRESEFRTLLALWEAARTGRGSAVLISGVAGLGKSRLLTDFFARLRASRARALLVRANPGDRAVSAGFVAAVAEAVAQRPGAAAISEESANVLVALAPALASAFPRATPDAATGEEAMRRRANALLDLIRAVSEESALALLIDDIHWADVESRRVLDAVTARLEGGRVLLVLAARPPLETLGGFAALPRFELLRFDLPRVAEFMTRLGELPAEDWAVDLPPRLLAATRGVPLAMVETLARLVETGAIGLQGHQWSSEEPSRIEDVLREGMVLEARVRSLSAGARELLLLLATLGRPTEISTTMVAGALVELEHRGFVSRQDNAVQTAHDEIAAAALGSATEGERVAAHRSAAQLFAEGPESDLALSLAAGHARAAGESAILRGVARRWIARQRALGHLGSAHALVEELLGRDVPIAERRALVRTLPWSQRPARGVLGTLGLAAAAFLMLVGWAVMRETVPPDLELYVRTDSSEPQYFRVVVPHIEDWRAGEPIEAEAIAPARLPVDVTRFSRIVLHAVGGQPGWYGSAFVGDSGGDEIVVADEAGRVSQPAPYRGDDAISDLSPDGRYLAFASARWHPETDKYNIAILDRETREVRRVVASDEFDTNPIWSPDGSRLAFVRRHYTSITPSQICVVHVDGFGLRCDWPGLEGVLDALVWVDDERVLVVTRGSRGLRQLNVLTGEVANAGEGSSAMRLPDRRVILVPVSATNDGRTGIALRRTGLEPAIRMIMHRGREVQGSVVLARAAARPRPVARVKLSVPERGVPLDLSYVLRADAVDGQGQSRRAHALRYRSLDDSIASVVNGRAQPRRLGVARIEVTAGGWRADTAMLRIVPSTVRDVIDERWSSGWEERWRVFGDPLPRVVSTRGRAALNPNGDGKYASGLYLRENLDTHDGVGLEFEASLPLTALQWQELSVALLNGTVQSQFEGWDHRSGFAPGIQSPFCSTTLGQEGADNRMSVPLVRHAHEELRAPAPANLYSGQWVRVRMQLWPDGRCGLAINGRPVLLSESPAQFSSTMVVYFVGHSVGTVVGLGRVRVWTGVRPGVDWSVLEMSRGDAAPE